MNHPTLFDLANPELAIDGMVRATDHQTSVDAALAIEPKRTALHAEVLDAFAAHGPMTDETLENLPQFRERFGPSTIRKRRSELYQQQALTIVGTEKNSRGQTMHVWGIA